MGERDTAHQPATRDVTALTGVKEPAFEAIVHMLDDGVIVLSADGHLKYVNPAALRMYDLPSGRAAAELIKRVAKSPCYDADGTRLESAMHPAALAFRSGRSFTKAIYGMDLPGGNRRWLLISGRLLNADDRHSDVLVSFSDITAERDDLDRLVHQATHDPLTALPNRAFVLRRITEALTSAGCRRLRGVLFIDLDDLKVTNDTLGHDAGDDLLNATAMRLREVAGPVNVVGRHGGDEFVVLIYRNAPRDGLEGLVRRLRARLAEPVIIADTTIAIRASVGFVHVDGDDTRSAEEILRDADRAMYVAKRAGRGPR